MMVDMATWQALSDAERREFHALLPIWQQVLATRGFTDGTDLLTGWTIVPQDPAWCFAHAGVVIPQPQATSRWVLQALLTDAIQNLGR
jgi:hypothetical protein